MSDEHLDIDFSPPTQSIVDFILSSLIAPSVLVDGGGLVETISPAAMADLQLSPDIAAGMPIERAIGVSVQDLDQFTSGTRTAALGQSTLRWRARPLAGMRADGGWLVEFQLENLPDGDTELSARSAHLESLLHDLTDRFESLNRYMGLISHDLQAPARRLLSFVELARHDLEDGADPIAKFDSIERGARHLLRLTTELLQYSRLGKRPILLEAVDAQLVFDETTEQLAHRLAAAHTEIDIPVLLPTVVASPTFLSVVFQNLLENAVKYAGEDAPRIELTWSEAGDNVRIDVRDRGIGIPRDLREAVFQPFRRLAASNQEHTGLGLATVRDLVERFGGSICITEGDVGQGTTFTLTLPRA